MSQQSVGQHLEPENKDAFVRKKIQVTNFNTTGVHLQQGRTVLELAEALEPERVSEMELVLAETLELVMEMAVVLAGVSELALALEMEVGLVVVLEPVMALETAAV